MSRWLRRGRVRGTGLVVGAVLAVATTALVLALPHGSRQGDRSRGETVAVTWQRTVVSAADLAQRAGVKLVRLSVSGDGGLIDLRYQVIDPDKANAVHEARTPPAIVDGDTGLVINQLLMGHAHTGQMKAAVTYYLVFENPGGWVHRGSRVTVLLGDAQVDDVPVT